MSDLSVFVDESGDVGTNSEYYLVTLVFHDQSRPIDGAVARLGSNLRDIGFPLDVAVHSGPVVRREEMYLHMGIPERKKVFAAMFNFALRAPVAYATLAYRKRELAGRGGVGARLRARLARDVGLFLDERLDRLLPFDRVIVYYDNGQSVVGSAIREAFGAKLPRVEFRLVRPSGYRLFQAADMLTTLELLRCKDAAGKLSRGELAFFGSASRLRRDYLRKLDRMRLP